MLATDLKTGTIFKENNTPFQVLKYEHIKSARGGATVKVRVRNLLTDAVNERSYNASASVESADVRKKNATYLYMENGFVFMDPDTFEQFSVSKAVVGDSARFLEGGQIVQVTYFENFPVIIELPITLAFEIKYTEPGFKGNTVSNVLKDAKLSSGAIVKVPTFIKEGDKVKIDTRTGIYISRA